MEDNNKFPEQEAPAKNTDNAFVQVGKDGAPVVPHEGENEQSKTESADSE